MYLFQSTEDDVYRLDTTLRVKGLKNSEIPSVTQGIRITVENALGKRTFQINISRGGRSLSLPASWHDLDTRTFKNHPSWHPNFFESNFFIKMSFSNIWLIFFTLIYIPWHWIRMLCLISTKYMFMVVIWVYCGLPWKIGGPKLHNW